MKTILNVSRLHQQELLSVLKMTPSDPTTNYILTHYEIINPDDTPTPGPGGTAPYIKSRTVTVAEYAIELAAYKLNHRLDDPMANKFLIINRTTVENVLAPDIINNINIIDGSTVPYDAATAGYDLILVGISDAGVDIFKKCYYGYDNPVEYSQLKALSDARDAGIPIVFTHDAIEVNSFCEPFPDDYYTYCGNFGIDSIGANDTEPMMSSVSCVTPAHAIMSSYFNLDSTLNIQPTHTGGLVLKANATIIYEDPARASGRTNYYLAAYEEVGKGKVVLCELGHCYGNFNQFFRPEIDECKILTNAVVWCLQ